MGSFFTGIGERKNVRAIIGITVAVIILGAVFIPISSSALSVNLTAPPVINNNQPVSTNAPPLVFNVGIALQPAQTLVISELQVVLDSQSGSPIRFTDDANRISPFDARVSLQKGSPFPSKGSVNTGAGGGYGYSYSYSFTSGQGFTGPVTIPYNVTIFPNNLSPGPHSLLVQIKDPNNVITPSGLINFNIGGNFGSNPNLSAQASPPSMFVPPTGSGSVQLTITSINGLHNSSPNVSLDANAFPGATISYNGTGVTGNQFTLNTLTKVVTMRVNTNNAIPGQYSIFLRIHSAGGIEVPLNIPVSIVGSTTPTILLNPPTANPGGSVTFDGFNFSPGATITIVASIPGMTGPQTIPVTQYTIGQGPNNSQVGNDGHIQGTLSIPPTAPTGTFPITVTDSAGKTATGFMSIFASGASDFQLNISPPVLNLPPPPPPGVTQDPNTVPAMEISITTIGSFTSPVTVQVQGLPQGVTALFDNGINTINPPPVGTTTSSPVRVKFLTTSNTPFGFFPISIQGSSGGNNFKFAQAQISIPPPTSFQGSGSGAFGVLSLNPTAGPGGTSVSFSGIVPSTFAGNTVQIKIADDPTILASTTVAAGGSFSGTFTMPSSFIGFGGNPITSPAGRFVIKAFVQGGPTLFSDFTFLSANANFRANVSPPGLPPVPAGSTSNTLTVTATSLPGKAGGTVNVHVRGLPPNTQTSFDGGSTFSGSTSSSMTLPAGGTVSKSIQFQTAPNTPPGPVPLYVELSMGSERYGFPVSFGVMPSASFSTQFGFANVFLSKTFGQGGDDLSITASGFTANSPLIIFFGGNPSDQLATTASADGSGSATIPIKIPSTLTSGTYPVRVRDNTGREAGQPFTIVGGNDAFSVQVSPSFLPPMQQGANPSPNTVTVTVTAFTGKTLSSDPTVTLKGLPSGVQGSFDGGAYSSMPTTTLTGISSGGTASTVISFKVSDFAPPGPFNAFVEVQAGSEREGRPINSGIMPKSNFINFIPTGGGPGTFNAFTVGSVFLSPNTVAAGDTTTISASGFTPNATPTISISTFPTPTAITLPGSATFDSAGSFTQSIRIPSSLPSGEYEVRIAESGGSGRFAMTRLNVISSNDVFSLNVSPRFLQPAPQGGQSDPVQITASALPGKNAGTVTIIVSGLPRGVAPTFDSNPSSMTTLTLGTGGTASTQLRFSIDSNTPPGPVHVLLRATNSGGSGSSQTVIRSIDFGVRPDMSFINFGAGLAPGAFNPFGFGSLILTPNSGASGDSITISASGFTANSTIASLNFGGTPIPLPSGTTFDGSGSFTQSIQVPSLSSGRYPVSISDSNGRNAVSDFMVTSASATMTLSLSPQFLPPAPQGQTFGQSDEATITVSALAGKTPGSVTLTLRGLPPSVSSYFNTGAGYSSSSPSNTATVNIGAGGSAQVGLKFAISPTATPGPVPLYLEASRPGQGETIGIPIPFGIRPSSTFGNLFGVGNVELSPFSGSTSDTVTITASGFTPGSAVTIVFGTDPIQDRISLPSNTNFDNTGFFSKTIKVPSNKQPGMYPVTVSDSSGRSDTKPFMVVGASSSFDVNVSPQFFQPIVQGSSSSPATVTVTSLSGKSAGTVTVSVIGLPPGVTVSFDGVTSVTNPPSTTLNVGTGSSSQTSLVLNVPSTTPPGGPYFIKVKVSSSSPGSDRIVPMGFGVMPGGALTNNFGSLFVTPIAGQAGDPVTISASGFAANQPVLLAFGLTPINLGGATFDSSGSFSTTVKVPSGSPSGFFPIRISDGTKGDSVIFNVLGSSQTMQLTVSPQFLPPVLQGQTSDGIVATVSSSPGKTAPPTTVTIEGLPPGASLLFDGSPALSKTLSPGLGGSASTTINIVTSQSTPPRPYPLLLTARSNAGDGQFKSVPIGFGVMPNLGGGQGFASLMINPSSVRPGESVDLTGTGFSPSTTFSTISVRVPGQLIPITIPIGTTVTVGSDGTWNTEIQVPTSAPPGYYYIIVTSGTGSTQRTASAPLNIIPVSAGFFDVNLSPDFLQVVQGNTTGSSSTLSVQSSNSFSSALKLKVSGLPPGLSVTLTANGGTTTLATFTGTSTGTIVTGTPIITPEAGSTTSIGVTVKASSSTPTGPYMMFIGAEQVGTGAARGEPLAIQVVSTSSGPSLILSPSVGPAGNQISVSGSGFGSSEQVTLTFNGLTSSAGSSSSGFTVVPNTITTTSTGAFTAQIAVPNIPNGLYPVQALGATSGKTATTQFQIIPALNGFSMQVAPKQVLLQQGSSTKQSITITPIGTFNSTITLSVLGLPSGVTSSFSPSNSITPIPGIPSPVTLTLNATSSANTGSAAITIVGTAATTTSGGVSVSEKAYLRIVSGQSTGDFIVTLAPKDLLVKRGATATPVQSSIKVIAVGTTQPATITLGTTLPTGLTATVPGTITPDSTTGIGTGTLSVSATSAVSLGFRPIVISANIPGIGIRNVTANVYVVDTLPTTLNLPVFDPSAVNSQTPLPLNLTFTGSTFNPRLNITSLTTDTSGSTGFNPQYLSTSPSNIGNVPTGFTGIGNDVLNIEPSSATSDATYSMCFNVPSNLPSGVTANNVKIAFLDTTQNPPVWTTVTTTISNGLACATNLNHFSDWSLIAGSSTQGTSSSQAPVTLADFLASLSNPTKSITGSPASVSVSSSEVRTVQYTPTTSNPTTQYATTPTISSVAGGTPLTIDYSNAWITTPTGATVTAISLTPTSTANSVTIAVRDLNARPSNGITDLATAAAGSTILVAKYLQIDSSSSNVNFGSPGANSGGITLSFKVDRAWISANNADSSTVSAYVSDSGAWSKLVTVRDTSADTATQLGYRATSPHLSTFGIGATAVGAPTVGGSSGGGSSGGGGGGGSGGGGAVLVNPPTTATTYDQSYFAVNPLAMFSLNNVAFMDLSGNAVSQVKVGHSVAISDLITNHEKTTQPYAYIVQVTDKDGFTTSLNFVQSSLASGQSTTTSVTWTPNASGTYTVKVFVWDGISNKPTALTANIVNIVNVR